MIQVGPTRSNICDRFDRETMVLDGSIGDYGSLRSCYLRTQD